MGKLILVRHGKTLLNSQDSAERLRGWMDVPLDEQGLREAEETAQRLAQHPVAHIYSSDLYRARQTAEAVVKATLAPIVHTSDLRPWNVGTLAGQRVQDILPSQNELWLSPISVWELTILCRKGRFRVHPDVSAWVAQTFSDLRLTEAPLTAEVALAIHRSASRMPTRLINFLRPPRKFLI